MWFFASVIIASKGKLYIKTIYILSGCLLIQLLNMVRISYLTWLMRDNAANVLPGITFFRTIQTDHHDLFNYTILLVVFLLIVVWFENGIIKSVKT
jgi:exosortase/archaeosortase family protein